MKIPYRYRLLGSLTLSVTFAAFTTSAYAAANGDLSQEVADLKAQVNDLKSGHKDHPPSADANGGRDQSLASAPTDQAAGTSDGQREPSSNH